MTELYPSDALSSLSYSSSFTYYCCLACTSAASLFPSFGRSNSAKSSTYSSSSSTIDFDGSVFSCAVSLFSSLAYILALTSGFASTSSIFVDSFICRKGRKSVDLSLASLSRTVLISQRYLLQPQDVLFGNALAEPVFLEEAIDQRGQHISVQPMDCISVFVEFLLLAVAAHGIIKGEVNMAHSILFAFALSSSISTQASLLLMLQCNAMLQSTVLLMMMAFPCFSWKLEPVLSAALQASLPSNLTDFQTAYNANRDELIIYGGKTGNQYSKSTYIISLDNATVHTLAQNQSSIRYQACIISINATLYLFGGYKVGADQTQQKSGEFWSLDLDSYEWSILHYGLEPYRFCEMVESSGAILIFGASFDGVLDAFSFSPQTNYFQNLTVQFFGSCSFSSTLWDGSSVQLSLPIELCPRTIPNLTLATTPHFPTDNISYIDLMETESQSMRFLQTENHIYSYRFSAANQSISIRYSSPVDKEAGSIYTKSVRFGGWNIYCNLNTQTRNFYLTFMRKSKSGSLRVTSHTPHYYSSLWPTFNNSALFSIALITPSNSTNSCILLIQHASLSTYLLYSNVFYDDIAPLGILNSLFGLNQCRNGWTGRNCTLPACPNSLHINGINNISVIRLECSGHGECGENGCECQPLWGGPDCSIYLRQSCKGTLQANFPLKNCECMDSKRGGNNCTTVFCPGDCYGHGKCTQGICSCDSNYYGSDCSTMIVSFPK